MLLLPLQEKYRQELFELLKKGEYDEVDPNILDDLKVDGTSSGGFLKNLTGKFTGEK